ncbi:MAG: hypothetical protein O7H41_17440 [Planctomycetota bacterium]|nr:hypothetical protein [Planctomycetota bacterium]
MRKALLIVDPLHQQELWGIRRRVKGGQKILSWVLARMTEHSHWRVWLHGVLSLGKMGIKERARLL